MTDDVGLLLNATIHTVGRTVPGAPPLDDRQRRFHAHTSPLARPTPVDELCGCAAPTLHQPLSHAASRRDSSPFRGAEGWAYILALCASVSHDADTVVFLPPVRGGVLDAPRLRDRRAALDASVRHDRQHPRHLRCVRLCPQPHLSNFAGTARAPFLAGVRSCPSTHAGRAWKPAPTGDLYISRCGIRRRGTARAPFCAGVPRLSFIPGRAGVEALPYGGWAGGYAKPTSSAGTRSVHAKRTGPRTGPFYAPKCPRAFQAGFYPMPPSIAPATRARMQRGT